MSEPSAVLVIALTALVFAFLIPFAAHRTHLLLLSRRQRHEIRAPWPDASLPLVTVQLPMYNEYAVAGRAIDAACSLDYPTELLEVQVLDDSDDDTTWLIEQRVLAWRDRGLNVQHVRRESRAGFKAGALRAATRYARGEFLLIFDADFVPDPSFLRELLSPMQDRTVGMVQAAWSHLNREENWLTEAQSYLLDGHFLYEQGGRYRGGRFFNFNGTAGLWRRSCLNEAGGWEADTLTEDLDLSYRAQLAGWRFVYLDDVAVPAEIPATVSALEVQQRRWAQGGVQTGRKILPGLLRSPLPVSVKLEAVVHLFGHLAHPLTWGLAFLLFPSAVARRALELDHLLGLDLLLFAAATMPFVVFYWTAGEQRGRLRKGRVRSVLKTLALGIGLSVPVSRAVFRGLSRTGDPFERTPKRGDRGHDRYAAVRVPADAFLKAAMAVLMTTYLVSAVRGAYWGQIPFILLFLSGYTALGLPQLRGALMGLAGSGGPRFVEHQREEREPEHGSREQRLGPLAGVLIAPEPEVAGECEAA
jgi:cellulose synthase/poly-beta-1,6-N-acetylglucosamine synthase-like glycosyltransferase